MGEELTPIERFLHQLQRIRAPEVHAKIEVHHYEHRRLEPVGKVEAPAPTTDTSAKETAPSKPSGDAGLEINVPSDALEFDKSTLSTEAGSEVVVVFKNGSSVLEHNWVLVNAGAKDEVATAGIAAGPHNNYIPPGDDRIIANSALLGPGATEEIRFTAPAAGIYQFVCTFPGHNFQMFGDFQVK